MATSCTLDYKGMDCVLNGNKIKVTPLFNCHFCGAENPVENSFNVNVNKEINFSNLVDFTLPCCGNHVALYVAVHKSKGVDDLAVCVQRSDMEGVVGISDGWWLKR